MKKLFKGVGAVLMAFCILVTGSVGALAIAYPRQVSDFIEVMYHVKQVFFGASDLWHAA